MVFRPISKEDLARQKTKDNIIGFIMVCLVAFVIVLGIIATYNVSSKSVGHNRLWSLYEKCRAMGGREWIDTQAKMYYCFRAPANSQTYTVFEEKLS